MPAPTTFATTYPATQGGPRRTPETRNPPQLRRVSCLPLEPTLGFEPRTCCLRNSCSTAELCRLGEGSLPALPTHGTRSFPRSPVKFHAGFTPQQLSSGDEAIVSLDGLDGRHDAAEAVPANTTQERAGTTCIGSPGPPCSPPSARGSGAVPSHPRRAFRFTPACAGRPSDGGHELAGFRGAAPSILHDVGPLGNPSNILQPARGICGRAAQRWRPRPIFLPRPPFAPPRCVPFLAVARRWVAGALWASIQVGSSLSSTTGRASGRR